MGKKIEDYLHLYLGCCIWDSYHEKEGVLVGITNSGINTVKILHGEDVWNLRYTSVKPILRPQESMTDEECDYFGISSDGGEYNHGSLEPDATYGQWHSVIMVEAASERINEMRKQGFDCDGLIEAGLAIDKTKLEVNIN